MPTTTPQMGLTKPTPGSDAGVWGTQINATIDKLDVHDHAAGSGVKIPISGLNINADLPMAGFAITGLKALTFSGIASGAGYNGGLFRRSSDNELCWRTTGGVDVQITSGNSLNAALLGGFTGDYGTGGSTANFNSGTAIYNFLAAATTRAKIDCSDIRLFQGSAAIANAVKIRSPNALAASYDWVFPAALPGAQSLLQISAAGQVLADNTGIQGIALAAGTHATISGAGLYKRGSRRRPINPSAGTGANGTSVQINTGSGAQVQTADVYVVNIPVDEGERITQIQARVFPDGAGDIVRMRFFRVDSSGTGGGVRTQLGADQLSVSGTTAQTLTLSGLTEVVGTSLFTYQLEFVATAIVVNAVNVTGIWVTTDVP